MKRKTGKERASKYAFGGGVPDPKTPVYKTQAEVDNANTFAKQFMARRPRALVTPENAFVATKVGDPVVPIVDNGKPSPRRLLTRLPSGIGQKDVLEGEGEYWFNDPHTGDAVFVSGSVLNGKYATGGKVGGNTDWEGIAGIADAGIGGVLGIVDALTGTKPSDYSTQPIVNSTTIKGMATPYSKFATGGEVGGGDLLDQLQAIADAQGVSVEDIIAQYQGQEEEPEDDYEDITDEGEDTEDDEEDIQDEYAYGGKVGKVPIEAEGGEVLQTPDGQVKQIKGPKHENGGVNMAVPKGTKIYSDRLTIEGKTMQERKVGREKTMKRLQKMLEKNPSDRTLQSTLQRTAQNVAVEEEHDMAIQDTLHKLNNKKFAGGGTAGNPIDDLGYGAWFMSKYGDHSNDNGIMPAISRYPSYGLNTVESVPTIKPSTPAAPTVLNRGTSPIGITVPTSGNNTTGKKNDHIGFTTGDYIGMAGGLFNAVAPIFNTMNAADATKPNINRFRGYGKGAVDANNKAQDIANEELSNTLDDISTSNATAIGRNRNSAQSVNTLRALDATTEMGANKARALARANKAKTMMGVLGQRSSIELNKDRVEMQGEANRDIQDKMDSDAFYSAMGQNLTNFGTNIQGIGKAVNVNHANNVNAKMISQLSKYGLTFDEEGNLISS